MQTGVGKKISYAANQASIRQRLSVAEILTPLQQVEEFVAVMHKPQAQFAQFARGWIFKLLLGTASFLFRFFNQAENGPRAFVAGQL